MNSLRESPWPTSCGTAAQRKSNGVLRKQHAFCICAVSNSSLWGYVFERLPPAIGYFDSLRDAPPHRQCVPGAVVIVTRSLGSVTLLQQLDWCNRLPHYHVIANQPAGWCGNPFSCNAQHCVGRRPTQTTRQIAIYRSILLSVLKMAGPDHRRFRVLCLPGNGLFFILFHGNPSFSGLLCPDKVSVMNVFFGFAGA